METLQSDQVVDEQGGDHSQNRPEEQKNQQATLIKINEKAGFDESLEANIPSLKHKTDEENTFSEEMLKEVNSDGRIRTSWSEYLDKAKIYFDNRMCNPQMPFAEKVDFEFLQTLGIGSYSKVLLVKHIETQVYYAAKLLTKAVLVRGRYIQHARSEKLILQNIRFVFTINLEFFFQDNVYIFFILPLVPGGELFTYLTKVNRLNEDQARFYSAQMLLALEYLHYMGLIFRDLKPENILIDSIGYLKLAAFGFCKAINQRTYTLCGTPEYLAPEMIKSRGYGKSADWWTFGVLLYELCAGYTPFYSDVEAKIYDNISKCRYQMPYHFSSELRGLIKNLLRLDLTRRYGNLKNGVDDIKEHKFYRNVPWIMLLNREIKAPYMPVISGPDDTSHFGKYDEKPLETSSEDLYYKEFADF